jgi:hypothetical protein
MGLGYQWNLDFAGPLSLTLQHSQYVLVMIKHFSTWLELMPLLDSDSEKATFTFLDRVFSRFGAPTKVFTNQSMEFHGKFQELCE